MIFKLKNIIILTALLLGLFIHLNTQAQIKAYKAPEFNKNWSKPGSHPDHIILTFSGDPSNSFSVTWRTDTSVATGYAEIALATAAPKFWRTSTSHKAKTEAMDASKVLTAEVKSHYHSVTFDELLPDTLYAYRVGDGKKWSEWFQFKSASKEPKPFSFLYVGDAQNFILELWSRLIREGYRKAPDAKFIVHAGDLVSEAHSEQQWHEWFTAGGWIHSMLPSIPVPGNHEYEPYTKEEEKNDIDHLSVQWKPQFTLPRNGPEGLEEMVYYVDYQGVRIIGLNSSEKQEEQAKWLEKVLSNNPNKWTVVTYHHPLFSASVGRDNKKLRELWKPIFDKYHVDLALQGHDHSYVRGRVASKNINVVDGMNTRDETGTVYVVSVSGGKMYKLKDNWNDYEAKRERKAENTQLFQVINVNGDSLKYQAFTATGELYDAFDLVKQPNAANLLIDKSKKLVAEYTHANTIPYDDHLPSNLKKLIAGKYTNYSVNRVRYLDEQEFKGYQVELKNGKDELNILIDPQGKVIKEEKD